MPEYMTIQEVADRLRVSYSLVYRLLNDPTGCKIPGAVKMYSTWRIPDTAIAEMEVRK